MDLGIAGRTALICGASRGIGSAIADALGNEGCRLLLIGRGADALAAKAGELAERGVEVAVETGDMNDLTLYTRAAARAADRFGPVDIAIFNGFSPPPGGALEVSAVDFERAHHQLVICFAALVAAVAPAMRCRRWGRIVTIGSNVARQPFRTEQDTAYVLANTARIAALGLSKTLANELAVDGITVNTILTGAIATETAMSWAAARAAEMETTSDAFIARFIDERVPMRRMGLPTEIASLAAFLCSDQAGYTTGDSILCDGGVVAGV